MSTVGFVFFGTPFRGSEALHPRKMVEAALEKHQSYEVQEGILRDLQPGSENLDTLVTHFLNAWRSQPKKPGILCFYEQRVSPVGKIVGGTERIVSSLKIDEGWRLIIFVGDCCHQIRGMS